MEIPGKILFKKHYANFHIAQTFFTFYQDKIYVLIKSMVELMKAKTHRGLAG